MNRTLLVGVALVLATGIQLWLTTRVSGYNRQALSALATVGFAVAAVAVLVRSLGGSTDRG